MIHVITKPLIVFILCLFSLQPSPPISEVSSPGGEGLTPPGGMMVSHRPHPPRSPYEWMKKTTYQSQPNPGELSIYV